MSDTLLLPIILCTGYTSHSAKLEPYDKGIKCFVDKPLDKRFLAENVRRFLDEKK